VPTKIDVDGREVEYRTQIASKLPRRPAQHPSVAELVKKYQEYLPPQGVEELAKTALSPNVVVSESEQEVPHPSSARTRLRSKSRQAFISRKASVSDFEHGYAANIAPKYLTHAKRSAPGGAHASRIPGPSIPTFESGATSRRSSPDKRPTFSRMHTDATIRGDRTLPPPTKVVGSGPFVPKGKGKSTIRVPSKDKAAVSRPTSNAGPKGTIKRPAAPGNKVSNIAKHFERINRDTERANRRYAVIRGRRARPVATARAKVEILESIKDVMKDDEESSESGSSEADDEGGDEDDAGADERSPKDSHTSPSHNGISVSNGPGQLTPASDSETGSTQGQPAIVLDVPNEDKLSKPRAPEVRILNSVPASPALPPIPSTPAVSPPELDLAGPAGERTSILKTLAGFWPQQTQVARQNDNDDPMSDPEHIFRDSSMVVRTDEPTSIIALALK
jgi:1-phosphatidylinositol-3-phosphate 5-kinase